MTSISTAKQLLNYVRDHFSRGVKMSGPKTKIEYLRIDRYAKGPKKYRHLHGEEVVRVRSLTGNVSSIKNIPLFPAIILELMKANQEIDDNPAPILTSFEEVTKAAGLRDYPRLYMDESYYYAFANELARRLRKRKNLKLRVALKDKFRCVYCGFKAENPRKHWRHFTIDHLVPRWIQKNKRRADDSGNLAFCCSNCNSILNKYRPKMKNRDAIIKEKRKYIQKRLWWWENEYDEFMKAPLVANKKAVRG
jgi:hypothetical protein